MKTLSIPERCKILYGKDDRLFKEITTMLYSVLVEHGVPTYAARESQKEWIKEWNTK